MPVDDDPLTARRIVLYGVTGSGKTTAAARIAAATGIPWHCVDDLTYEPGWVNVPTEQQRRLIAAICGGEEWVLDTMYTSWSDIPLARAELVIGLDYPRWLSLGRLLRRTVTRIADREPVCNGNTETLRNSLSPDSILVWHFRSFASKHRRLLELEARPDGPQVLRLRHPRQLDAWIASLRSGVDHPHANSGVRQPPTP